MQTVSEREILKMNPRFPDPSSLEDEFAFGYNVEEERGSGLEVNQVFTFEIRHPSEHVTDCSSNSGVQGRLAECELHGARQGHVGLQQAGRAASST